MKKTRKIAALKWLVQRLKGHRKAVVALTVMQCMVAGLGVGTVVVNKYLVDRATVNSSLTAGICIMLGATLLSVVLNLAAQMWQITLQEKCSFGMRAGVYKSILGSKWMALQRYHSEDVLTRLTSDVEQITTGVLHILTRGGSTVVGLVMAFTLLAYYDWTLALITLAIVPIGLGLIFLLGGRMKRYQENFQKTESAYRVFLQENLKHQAVIKAFEQEYASEETLWQLRDQRLHWLVKRRRISIVTGTVVNLIFTMGATVAFLFGVVKIAEGSITFGTLTAFLSLVGQVQQPALALGEMARRGITVLASVSRVMEVDELEQEHRQQGESLAGGLRIRGENIAFSYGEKAIFRNWNVDIAPGETVAITGHSGAGKTTFVRLLLGFAEPCEGSLYLEDEEGKRLEMDASARQYISYVPQGNTLFHGTIRENLQLGAPNAADEAIWEALEVACAADFVRKLPKGLDTMIGEKAAGISEGQAQRLAIARALLRKVPIVIFDEATSALDPDTEVSILEKLCRSHPETTYIFITHRQAAQNYCSQCIAVEEM